PPTATSFPYTTLFRSGDARRDRYPDPGVLPAARPAGDLVPPVGRCRWPGAPSRDASSRPLHGSSLLRLRRAVFDRAAGTVIAGLDRKSTRLNSSHVAI